MRLSQADKPSQLLSQSLDRCPEEVDRQAAACPQRRGQNRLEYTQVRSKAAPVPAKRVTLAMDVVDRVRFRQCVEVFKCLHNMAPGYLSSLC